MPCAARSSSSGASLGGLTALLLGLLAAPRVGGVFAQSGSFFQVRHDDAESGYRYFCRISRLVQAVLDMRAGGAPARRGHDVRRARGERRQQPRHGHRPAARRARRDASTRSPTCTTTRRGATPRPVPHRRAAPGLGTAAWLRGSDPGGRVGSHGDHLGATAGAGSRRDARGRAARLLGTTGAALPVGGRLGPRRRAQRHAGCRARARRGGPGEPVLRRHASTPGRGRRTTSHRGAGPAGGHLHGVASDVVLPWVVRETGVSRRSSPPASRSGPTTRCTSRCSAPTSRRWPSGCPATTTRRRGTAGARSGTRRTSPTPRPTSPTWRATTSSGSARACRCCSSSVRAPFEESPTRSLQATRAFAEVLSRKGIRHELDVWGHDSAHDWPWWQRQLAHHLPRFV